VHNKEIIKTTTTYKKHISCVCVRVHRCCSSQWGFWSHCVCRCCWL